MVIDKRGDLWIIQRGNDHPMSGGITAKYKAAVKCYKTDGTFTSRQITDVVNPRALGYDAAQDQLLVAENGPDLNVRFYTHLDQSPSLVRTFGEQAGIYNGQKPGLIHDPATGGYARFAGIAGVGVDKQGKLYVGGGFQGTDLRMFTPNGKLGWMLNSLMFCNTYDVDPASDGTEIYGPFNHLHLDLSETRPGKEQKYLGYNWDLRRFGEPERAGNSQAIVRRLGPDKRLIMFTTGQGVIGDIHIYRYDGEIAVPAGGTRDNGSTLWIDTNGNGKVDSGELTKMASPISWITGLCVDSRGDIWAANTGSAGSFMRHFTFKGFNASEVPVYSGVKDEGYEDIPFPEEGAKTNGWGMASRMDYDADRDILVAYFPAQARTGEGDKSPPQYLMARYDNWSKGNRKSKWKVKGLRPETDADYFMYEVKLYPYSGYMGMQIAGDYIFFAYLFGEVHVFDLGTGKLVEILAMGPEVNGQCAWEDAAMGLRAFKTQAGEYLIFTENSGWGGKNNLFRWKP
jgi:sugar lactone lactonase YvrE